jgi:hypothetical protein
LHCDVDLPFNIILLVDVANATSMQTFYRHRILFCNKYSYTHSFICHNVINSTTGCLLIRSSCSVITSKFRIVAMFAIVYLQCFVYSMYICLWFIVIPNCIRVGPKFLSYISKYFQHMRKIYKLWVLKYANFNSFLAWSELSIYSECLEVH